MSLSEAAAPFQLLGWIQRHPRGLLVAALFAVIAAVPGLGRLVVDNSPRAFVVRAGAGEGRSGAAKQAFSQGPVLALAWFGDGLWSEAGIDWLSGVTREAAAVPGVASVDGPLEATDWWTGAGSPAEAANRLRADPLARAGGWTGPDDEFVGVAVELESALGPEAKRRALDGLAKLTHSGPQGVEGVLVGLAVIEQAMDRSYRRLLARLFPAVGLLCTLLLVAVCRDLLDSALPLFTVAVAEVTLLGLMGWIGVRLNLISSTLLPIVFVLGLVTATHLQMSFRRHRRRRREPMAALSAALTDRAWAIFWTAVTTAAAFGSFAFSPVPAVRDLGIWTAAGVGLILVSVFAVQVPVILLLAPARAWVGDGESSYDRLGRRLGGGVVRAALDRRWATVVGFVLVGGLAAAGLGRLELETGLLSYFSPDDPPRAGFEALAERGGGAVAADLVLRLEKGRGGGVEGSFRDPEQLERLAELGEVLRREPLILGALGPGDIFRAAGSRIFDGGPRSDSAGWLVLGLLQTDPEANRRLSRLVTADGRAARLSLRLPVAGYEALLPALERAVDRTREYFPEARVEWSGDYPRVLVAQRAVLQTMASSFGFTLLVVAGVLAALLRSWRRWVVALAANLWPLLIAAGLMGWAGLPFDSTTVMIAAVILGIAVDDTLHTFAELRSTGGRVAAAIERVAPAQLLTTLALGVGFLACGLSDFLPIAHFGLVTAVALVAALAGDWLLLPGLLGRGRDLLESNQGPPSSPADAAEPT